MIPKIARRWALRAIFRIFEVFFFFFLNAILRLGSLQKQVIAKGRDEIRLQDGAGARAAATVVGGYEERGVFGSVDLGVRAERRIVVFEL